MNSEVDWGWTLAEIFNRESEALELLFRWRDIPRGVDRGQWPTLLIVTWENRFSTPEGFPVEREWDAMSDFELRLGEATEHDALAVMSLSLTGNKERMFLFHTKDVEEFSKRLHELPQEEQRYPIRIEKRDDPGWAYLAELFERYGVDPHQKPSLWQRIKNLFD
jgi:hypothetical protein